MTPTFLRCLPLLVLASCSEAVDPPAGTNATATGPAQVDDGESILSVPVPESGRVYVGLSPLALVDTDGASTDWDLAFEGRGVFTNGGASGPGNGGAFGPLDRAIFDTGELPDLPFLDKDMTGGPFIAWYQYDGTTHALWSRYHVYGVRDGDRLYKLQILGYYGDVGGAPVSALYHLRYAEVSGGAVGPTKTLDHVDATGEGASAHGDTPGACLDLGTGEQVVLTATEAKSSKAWHLCFRRDRISLNGGLSGPRGVEAADLDADATATETLQQVQKRTAGSELQRFNAVSYAALTDPDLAYQGDDAIRSAFTDRWISKGSNPLSPEPGTWLVAGAGGARHLVIFPCFEGATASSPGAVELHQRLIP